MAPTEIVRQLIERVMEGARTGNFAPALALYAADVVITQEFAFPKPIVTQGKARLVAAIEAGDPAHKPLRYANISVHGSARRQFQPPPSLRTRDVCTTRQLLSTCQLCVYQVDLLLDEHFEGSALDVHVPEPIRQIVG